MEPELLAQSQSTLQRRKGQVHARRESQKTELIARRTGHVLQAILGRQPYEAHAVLDVSVVSEFVIVDHKLGPKLRASESYRTSDAQ